MVRFQIPTVFRSPLYLQSNQNLREALDCSCLLLHLLDEFALDLLALEVAMLDGTRFLPKAEEDSGCWVNLGRFQRSDLIAPHLNDLGSLTNLKKITKNLNTKFNIILGLNIENYIHANPVIWVIPVLG